MSAPSYISEPQVQYLVRLLDEIKNGKLFVPQFQRGFVWDDEKRLELLDSIKNGIPIGGILVWRTTQHHLSIRDEIGGLKTPSPPEPTALHIYLLDGHQRLATLYGTLKRPVNNRLSKVNGREWQFFYDLENEVFHIKKQQDKPRDAWMPVNVLLNSIALLRFQRTLHDESLIERADQIAYAFRNYKIGVIPIVTNDLEHAATAFQRINSSGTVMSDVDMIAALTYIRKGQKFSS
ncbi:MAG: DUF262 domain-containing protein [Gammaproteobacteria bacterium]|nr:DUF262 domain-containing protein [Gammaproteobacteria bacterium]